MRSLLIRIAVALALGIGSAGPAAAGLQFTAQSSDASATLASTPVGTYDCNGSTGFAVESHVKFGGGPPSVRTQLLWGSSVSTSSSQVIGMGVRVNGAGTKEIACRCNVTDHYSVIAIADSNYHQIA